MNKTSYILKTDKMTAYIKTVKLNHIILKFYDYYVIGEILEDVVFDGLKKDEVVKVCEQVFKEQRFVYISDRKNKYNVSPVMYFELTKVKNLAGIAVVSQRFETLKVANFEKQFSPVPFKIFTDMEQAATWAKSIL